MLETSARLLRLLSLLQARPEWSGPELAARLGVTTRTVRRDVDKLRGLDYPVEVDLGPTGGYRLGAGAQLPPLLLDDAEAVAVAVTLQTAAGSAGIVGLEEQALGALLKLERLLPDRLRRRIAAVGAVRVPAREGPAVDAASLVAVGSACRDRRVLDLDYTALGGAESRRRVEPHHLVSWGRRWYLVAFDLGRADWRTLRLDRLRPRVGPDGLATGPRFTPRDLPGGDDPARFVADRVAAVRPFRVQALVDADVATVRARIWTDQVRLEDTGDGRCRVRLAVDTASSAVMLLTGLDLDFSVEDPPELVDEVRRVVARWERAVGGQPTQLTPPTQPTTPPSSVPMP